MKINRINYEEFIVNSIEGMLTTEEQAELDAFLHEHPQLKQELAIYKLTFLVPDTRITYPNKSVLLKPETSQRDSSSYNHHSARVTSRNYEEYVVKSLEGNITNEEQASLDAFLHEHPELKSEVDAYKLAFLVPDKRITYPHKSLLLKQEERVRTITPFYRRYSVWMSVAATVLLLLVFRVFMNSDDLITGNSNEPVAQSRTGQHDYALSERTDLPGRQVQEDFIPTTGNPQEIRIAANPSNSGHVMNQQVSERVKDVSLIQAKGVAYLPQAQTKPRTAALPLTASERALALERQQAQHTQGALITNAALVGKTLWHLSGRQLPNEAQSGQQFHVVQVNYNSKDFSFVKIIH